jgi:hypothetical protein
MDNKVGETVIFYSDLHCRFSSDFVEDLKVYSFSTKKFDTCEDWSANNNEHSFKIADFNVFIDSSGSLFNYSNGIQYGFFPHENYKLFFLPVASQVPKRFEVVGTEFFEQKYPVPRSMWDFANFIDNFLFHVMQTRLELKSRHAEKMAKQIQLVDVMVGDDLPF